MHKGLRIGIRIIKIALTIVICIIFIRLCFFDIFRIPGDSMKNALKHRDYIIINKTPYGGILSALFHGCQQPALNDLFVFRNNNQYVVKRCIGLPGTTIEVKNGIPFLNGQAVQEPLTIRHFYKIWFSNNTAFKKALNESNIDIFQDHFKKYPNYISAYLDNNEKNILLNKTGIDSITLHSIRDEFPEKADTLLEIQNVHQLLIPYRGMKIKTDAATINTYSNILTSCEGIQIKQTGNKYLFNRIPTQEYVFKNDYYYLMGDNRDNSFDSRYFGPIPQKRLVGKVIAIF